MSYETYYIPANYTDAGRIFGLFEIRNVIEAVLLGAPIVALCARFLPLDLTTKIIVTLIIFIPSAGFAMTGINGDSLSRYLKAWLRWRKKRRILTYKGETNYHEFERAFIRRKRQGA
jgi:hypothetical protein